MKKCLVVIILSAICSYSIAQTINVHFNNGSVINFKSENVKYIDFSEKENPAEVSDAEAIDLGLSVLWASCNLGAKKPEQGGDKYAWGETKTKTSFEAEDYAYYDKDLKVCTNIGYSIAGTEFDAATQNLGKGWMIPTYVQFYELKEKCTWEWTKINDVLGYKITGMNGNSIFLPAIYYENSGRYWTSVMSKDDGTRMDYASSFFINPDVYWGDLNQEKFKGLYIRPIKVKE